MAQKSKLLDLLQHAQDEMLRFAGSLSEEERENSGSSQAWAARDYLAHAAEWKRHMVELNEICLRGQTPPEEGELGVTNETIFHEYCQRPWADIQTLMDEGHQKMLDQLQPLTEEALNDPERFAWTGGSPLWRRYAGNGFLHVLVHVEGAYLMRGEKEYATRMIEQAYRMAAGLDESPTWQGIILYDQACHYALIGEKEKAFQHLEPGLRLSPHLIDWSKEDTDLVSLHGDAEFQAMHNRLSSANS